MGNKDFQKPSDEQSLPSQALGRRSSVGRAGEDAAAEQLLNLGYRLEARNWRCRTGEIDIIAEDGSTLVFVEVRARTNPTHYGTALEAITPRKCRQVREVATVYLKQCKVTPHAIRFDVIAVTFLRNGVLGEIKHLPGAF